MDINGVYMNIIYVQCINNHMIGEFILIGNAAVME